MDKIPLWMNFIAGILLAYDLFPKSGILSEFHERIKKIIKELDTKNFTNLKTMIFSGSLSIFIFLMLLLWVYYKNRNNINYNVGIEIGWFFLGVLVAWGLITGIAKLFKNVGQLAMLFIGIILSLAIFILVFSLHPSSNLATVTTSFVYICTLYPFGMNIADNVQKALLKDDKPFYIFAILGFSLFIVSSLLEIFG